MSTASSLNLLQTRSESTNAPRINQWSAQSGDVSPIFGNQRLKETAKMFHNENITSEGDIDRRKSKVSTYNDWPNYEEPTNFANVSKTKSKAVNLDQIKKLQPLQVKV